MSSYDSKASNYQTLLNALNSILRENGCYVDFTTGALFSLTEGHLGALEDSEDTIYLVDENTGEILIESSDN